MGERGFVALLDKVRRERGLNCHQYKVNFLKRRLAVRLRARGVESYREYARLLDDEEYELRNLIGQIVDNAQLLSTSAEELSALTEEVNVSAKQVSSTVEEMAKGAETQAGQVEVVSRYSSRWPASPERSLPALRQLMPLPSRRVKW